MTNVSFNFLRQGTREAIGNVSIEIIGALLSNYRARIEISDDRAQIMDDDLLVRFKGINDIFDEETDNSGQVCAMALLRGESQESVVGVFWFVIQGWLVDHHANNLLQIAAGVIFTEQSHRVIPIFVFNAQADLVFKKQFNSVNEGILIVVSAGHHQRIIALGVARLDIETLLQDEFENNVQIALIVVAREKGESVSGLLVWYVHLHTALDQQLKTFQQSGIVVPSTQQIKSVVPKVVFDRQIQILAPEKYLETTVQVGSITLTTEKQQGWETQCVTDWTVNVHRLVRDQLIH